LEGRTLFGLFGKQRKSLPGLARDLKDLTVSYAKQETLDPIKSLGKFLLFGTVGSFLIGIGLVLVALGGLLTWVPYVAVLAGCALIAFLSVWAIFSEKRRAEKRRRRREERKAASESTSSGAVE
jgi:ABC-type transport system involved in Fe-S cluster assembly fused permease/ATPase subunit